MSDYSGDMGLNKKIMNAFSKNKIDEPKPEEVKETQEPNVAFINKILKKVFDSNENISLYSIINDFSRDDIEQFSAIISRYNLLKELSVIKKEYDSIPEIDSGLQDLIKYLSKRLNLKGGFYE